MEAARLLRKQDCHRALKIQNMPGLHAERDCALSLNLPAMRECALSLDYALSELSNSSSSSLFEHNLIIWADPERIYVTKAALGFERNPRDFVPRKLKLRYLVHHFHGSDLRQMAKGNQQIFIFIVLIEWNGTSVDPREQKVTTRFCIEVGVSFSNLVEACVMFV
ncbi:hypothetical protein JHK84_050942 [Glycine max]|nr:hypothetical protein JHK84_050942 [Glycine max]